MSGVPARLAARVATSTRNATTAAASRVGAALLAICILAHAAAQDGPALQVHYPERVTAGEPIGIEILSWLGGTVAVTLNGQELPVFDLGSRLAALSLAPLGSEDGVWPLHVVATDVDGTVHEFFANVTVTADPRPVEELSIPASVLSLSTTEARDVEAAMVERVWANALPEPLWTDTFLLPVDGNTTSSYGDPRRYAPGGRVSYHEGTDTAAPQGTPIHATNAGYAVVAADFPTYPIKGGLVIIDHGGGLMSYYLHQSRVLVEEGSFVERGQVIGEVGTTGLSTGPHLHWEMRLNNRGTNPLSWVGRIVPY